MVSGKSNNCWILSNGLFVTSGSTTELFLEVVNSDNLPISDCIELTTEVVRTYPEVVELDDCGCPIENCDKASLRINIKKNISYNQTADCGFKGFVLDSNGLVLFNLHNNTTTHQMNSQCCSQLGFTPIIENGAYVCRWGEEVGICDEFTPLSIVDGIQIFLNGLGKEVSEVPSAECCPKNTTSKLMGNGSYQCQSNDTPNNEYTPPNCNGYTPNQYLENGVVMFNYNGSTTTTVPYECCESMGYTPDTYNGRSVCKIGCTPYVSVKYSNKEATFHTHNGDTFNTVPLVECCPIETTATPIVGENGVTVYKCIEKDINTNEECRYVDSVTFINPNMSGTLTKTFRATTCNGEQILETLTMMANSQYLVPVQACVRTNTLPSANFEYLSVNYNDNINCE